MISFKLSESHVVINKIVVTKPNLITYLCFYSSLVPKPGVCPTLAAGGVGLCAEFCSNDADCTADHKCCSNGCGHSCMPPGM